MVYDVAVIGGGIVGLAAARAILKGRQVSLAVLEAESSVATHQTGHNSSVIHSGIYYRPGSLKARNCVRGRRQLYRFCEEHGIRVQRCGKLIVAVRPEEIPRLRELERRGQANGLDDLERLNAQELSLAEPGVHGLEGLRVPQTGVVDFGEVARTLARQVLEAGGKILTGFGVERVIDRADVLVLRSAAGEVQARHLLNCGGLQSDRILRMCGLQPDLRIIPFRGSYYRLVGGVERTIRGLVYPVPDPRLPFLGVHLTPTPNGEVLAGPTAVLSLSRQGYGRMSLSARDLSSILSYPGSWKMAARFWRTSVGEIQRAFSKHAFVRELRRLMPAIRAQDLEPALVGIRAQAVDRNGMLVDDFHVRLSTRMIHVLNAPSPAATACLSIGELLAEMAEDRFSFPVSRT